MTKLNFDDFLNIFILEHSYTLFFYLFISLLMYSQDVSVRALIDKFMFYPV